MHSFETLEIAVAELNRYLAGRLGESGDYWVGLVGVPGSGKTTLGKALDAFCIPMDGYHYPRAVLDTFPDPKRAHERRGAPYTFDGRRFVADLRAARLAGHGRYPTFDHNVGDPVEDGLVLTRQDRLVVVEGNYLLLDERPWSALKDDGILDEIWYLDPGLDTAMHRLFLRHQETGLTPRQALWRILDNDYPNAEVIVESRGRADRVIVIGN